ncbi:interleukin 21 receptor, tandem duplicate 2 [Danio aesculapii]|uniref:interleukin 21 receptor, tandem duplicate 2 n=1 Tax=Danio aesculapii TaxID=1142201 RepID=UPI0024BF60F6|nr:interleukin 21 receptor, tandem duplicate 2 [Danio aesculapii]
MSRIGIICLFWAFSMEFTSCSHAQTKPDCVTDYWKTINCSLKLPVTSFINTSYSLGFQKNKRTYRCPLHATHEALICTLQANFNFKDTDKYIVTLHYIEKENNMSPVLDRGFAPSMNIKPTAPFNLTLELENGTYVVSWKSGYEHHPYKNSLLPTYQFLYYKDGDQHNVSAKHHVYKEKIEIGKKLDPGSSYSAVVRTEMQKKMRYNGTWSDWSSPVKWSTAYRDEPYQVGKIFIGVLSLLALIIVPILISAARFKMKEIAFVPTPESYFQPLYQKYQGNFQGWVLAKSPLQSIHVLEDFSTIDKISEVIYTFQDQTEKTVIYPPVHCHPSYVGPSTELWAPCQMTKTCSETSVLCEDFSVFCEDLPDKVEELMLSVSLACLSEDVESLKDSAVSLESLEDCEFTQVPVIINPVTVCFKQDYCTLTDTPSGPVPTFSREGELDENTSGD